MSRKALALYLSLVVVLLAVAGFALYTVFGSDDGQSASMAGLTTTSAVATGTSADAGQQQPAAAGSDTSAVTTVSTSTGGGSTQVTSSADSYKSATTSITVTKVSTGSGNDKVTYYVADVQLTGGALLQGGWAEGFQSGQVAYTSAIAKANNAILAVNGDMCADRNTGIIIRNGKLYLNTPTRMGLAIYKDGTMKVYDETKVSADQLLADGVYDTFSFGPALINEGVIPDGLDTTEIEDIGTQHTILGQQPRTGIGIISQNHFVFVVVDGRSEGYSRGATLSEFAQIFKGLGCTTAYNLDGGGSSTMYFQGQVVNDPQGQGRERGVSDILYVAAGS